ncbi:MAG: S1 family peptidase [Bifidobacteriaceae bacterium]|jgi:hypothetical protein|nr:S1 family peptidase [Bifidobacteriaceae bacterium]
MIAHALTALLALATTSPTAPPVPAPPTAIVPTSASTAPAAPRAAESADLDQALARDLGIGRAEFDRLGAQAARAARLADEIPGVGPSDVSLNPAGEILVRVDSPNQAVSAARLGARAVPATAPPPEAQPPAPPVRPMADSHAAAGTKLITRENYACTLGFWGYDASGGSVALTAGHCQHSGGAVTSSAVDNPWNGIGRPGPAIGGFSTGRYGEGYDAATIRARGARVAAPAVKTWDGAGTVPVKGTAAPVVGMPVCKSGSRTGWTCGTVTALPSEHVMAGTTTTVSGFATSLCSAAGDSGAPVVSGAYAVGILSFGSFDIRPADTAAACAMPVQIDRFIGGALTEYPAGKRAAVRDALTANVDSMILTGVFPMVGPGPSVETMLGDGFRLQLAAPSAKVTKAVTRRKAGTVLKGRVNAKGAIAKQYRVYIRVKDTARTVKVNARGRFALRLKSIRSGHPTYRLQVRSITSPVERSRVYSGKTK